MPDVIAIVTAVLVVAVAVVLMLAAMTRCVCHIRRTARIKASAQKIFPPIGDLRDLVSWAPRPTRAAGFTMLPQGGATQLDRGMYGSSSFLNKVMDVFINLDMGLARMLRQTSPV